MPANNRCQHSNSQRLFTAVPLINYMKTGLTDDTVLAEELLNDGVVGDGDSLTVGLGVSALVDELTDGLEVRLAVGDVRLNEGEHLLGGLGHADKDTVVDLEETEELQDFLGLGGDLGDTVYGDDCQQ